MVEFHDRITVPGGKERDILVLGVSWQYLYVRNLDVLAGRFFDDPMTQRARTKWRVITQTLANTLYGSQDAAIGQQIKLSGLPFTVIGTFRERVDTFGQSEISEDTILIPYTVARFFTNSDSVTQLFFSVCGLQRGAARHRRQIQNVLRFAASARVGLQGVQPDPAAFGGRKTANTLSTVLLLVSVLTLLVSGVGIMNIMLATVNARIREIGVRKAVGATKAEIRAQFLTEAMLISLSGGIVGILARTGAAVFGTLYHRLSRPYLRMVGGYRGGGIDPGRRAVWHGAGGPGGAAGSGREPALRVSSTVSLNTKQESPDRFVRASHFSLWFAGLSSRFWRWPRSVTFIQANLVTASAPTLRRFSLT